MKNGLSMRSNLAPIVQKGLATLAKADVLVGIPAENNARKEGPLTNSEIGYIQETGSPANNIPARPWLKPGIKSGEKLIVAQLGEAAKLALAGNITAAQQGLAKAGMLGRNAVIRYIDDESHFEPNAPSTIARKKSDHPLIDTSEMRRAVTFVVRAK